MVRFCNKCNRAVDDLDKFCRSCGYITDDSIDYHTYYRSFIKGENDQLLWFMKGAGIALQQEIKEINEKVDLMYQKLFPHSVGELREEFKIFEKKEEKVGSEIVPEEKVGPEIVPEEKVGPEIVPEEKVGSEIEKKEENVGTEIEKKEENVGAEIEKKEENVGPEIVPEVGPIEKVDKKEEKVGTEIEKKEERVGFEIVSEVGPIENVEKKEEKVGPKILDNIRQDEMEVPKEVNDKLGMLLQEDEGQRQAVQYLINKYADRNKVKKVGDNTDNNKSHEKLSVELSVDTNIGPTITIVPKEEVVRIGKPRGKGKEKGELYKIYDVAIHPFIPDILKSIESSKDGMIRIRLLDIAKKMGEKFIDKKPVTIYSGLKYSLFDHNIVVEMGSLKDVDPVTKENIKVLKMRLKNPNDMLPPSMLLRKGDIE